MRRQPCPEPVYHRSGSQSHKVTGAMVQLTAMSLRAGAMDTTSHGVCAAGERDGQEKPTTSPPQVTPGASTAPVGVLLEEISVIHPPVMSLNDLFTPPKNPEHQRVLSHRPNNHQVPRSHNPLQHNQLTWLNSPALDTHQPHDNFVLHYRYISPQNMNMLKHPIMFWHACEKKKPMATKTTACQWQLLHAHTKLNYILLKRDIIMAFVSPHPSPSPIPLQNKGEISTRIKH